MFKVSISVVVQKSILNLLITSIWGTLELQGSNVKDQT